MSNWIAKAWAFIKSMPLILGGIAVAVAAVMAARRSKAKALREVRQDWIGPLDSSLSPSEQAKQIDQQLQQLERAQAHVKAANEARRTASAAASRIETAGHPSVAEIVREWNRE